MRQQSRRPIQCHDGFLLLVGGRLIGPKLAALGHAAVVKSAGINAVPVAVLQVTLPGDYKVAVTVHADGWIALKLACGDIRFRFTPNADPVLENR